MKDASEVDRIVEREQAKKDKRIAAVCLCLAAWVCG
jgi:hypothetical protein